MTNTETAKIPATDVQVGDTLVERFAGSRVTRVTTKDGKVTLTLRAPNGATVRDTYYAAGYVTVTR